ncbi:MAG: hypothetical protein QCI38_03310, partial [Candidatus Thermoplasmatota archaeon]|nr:hypothetical protein [Candidatus Thermoplasmatota archaeon]
MECPKCKYIMVEDLDAGLATCPKCSHVMEMGGPELPKETGTIGVGRILGAAAKVYRMEMHRFLGIWAVPAFLVFLLNFLFWLAFYTLPADTQIREDMVPMLISMIFASSLFSAMISIFFAAPVIRMATDVFFHNKTTVSSGLSVFNKKLAILLAFSIMFSIPFALPDLFGGSLLCYIPAMMCCYWWMFALVILVIEGSELREAFSLGKEFATRSGSFSFAMLVMLSIATMEISFQY